MGAGPRQRAVRLYRGQMPSPGRPTVAWREDRVRFWAGIARGLSSEEAAAGIGVSQAVGTRWFRHAGGVGPNLPATVSGRYLSFSEREDIALWRAQDVGVREIARRLGRSPSAISRELRRNASTRTYRLDYRDDESMRVSHEAIYQALYVQGRGALRRELTACLRTGRALRVPRARTRGRGKKFVTPEIMISERPAEAADRAVPGHWEGDLIMGLNRSAIGTLVERTTRFTLLLHLPRMDDHGDRPRVKNGPALAGHGAEALRAAIAASILTLPELLRR